MYLRQKRKSIGIIMKQLVHAGRAAFGYSTEEGSVTILAGWAMAGIILSSRSAVLMRRLEVLMQG